MPFVNPLVQGGAPAGGGGAPPAAQSPAEATVTAPSHSASGTGFSMGNLSGGLTHPDNTAAHVGCLVAVALGVIVVFKLAGFRFAVDAGVAGGSK